MRPVTSNDILPEPPEELKQLSTELSDRIREKIDHEGSIPFSEFMEIALYEPGLGYYSAGLQKFGEGGDFVTAPQLGDVFARCLAYRILERSAHLRQVQKETLTQHVPEWMDKISWLDEPPEKGWQGVFLANEVLDALTVERFCIESDGPRQMRVTSGPDGFEWLKAPCAGKMKEQIQAILSGLDHYPVTGYCSEINISLSAWLQTVTASLQKGLALFIDYGYTRRDYYQPQRSDGTLICHYQHRAHADPFKWVGLTDISASVDFTTLAEAADACGLDVSGYTTQAMFLMASGLDEVIAGFGLLPDKQRLKMHNQVLRLTLPGEMGERFQVMALSRGLEEELSDELTGFSLNDLCHRL
jgi:SAM-dependent MidA family methyltransferase